MTTSYTDLIDDIPTAAFARNQNLIDNMERVVSRAQTWIVLRLDHDAFRAAPTTVTITSDGLVVAPPDTLEIRAIQVRYRTTGWTGLRRRSEEMLETLFASEKPGMPTFYSQTDDGYKVYPLPRGDIEARVLYNQNPPMLSPTVDTNILTTDYPEVLRAATMREAAIFQGDEVLSGVFTAETQEVLTAANAAIARRRRDETGQRPRETANAQGS